MVHDLVSDPETLRYWHAKQMRDPVARVAELEALIMDWTRHQDPWFDYARHEQVNEALRREGMRLWKLSWLPPEEPISWPKYLDEILWWNRWTGEQM